MSCILDIEDCVIAFLYSATFWITWFTMNHYFSRFVYDDLVHSFIMNIHMAGVLFMIINIEQGMFYRLLGYSKSIIYESSCQAHTNSCYLSLSTCIFYLHRMDSLHGVCGRLRGIESISLGIVSLSLCVYFTSPIGCV